MLTWHCHPVTSLLTVYIYIYLVYTWYMYICYRAKPYHGTRYGKYSIVYIPYNYTSSLLSFVPKYAEKVERG